MLGRTCSHIFSALALALLAGSFLPVQAAPPGDVHVVVISIDGLAAYYLSDPRAPLPILRKLAAEGAAAEALHVSNPATTWPNHTTLVTGVSPERHGVLFNGLLIRGGPGQPVGIEGDHRRSELIAVPTLFDVLHQAGCRTAAINWPCTRGDLSIDDNWPDTPEGVAWMTPRLRAELVRAHALPGVDAATFAKRAVTEHDRAWTAAAVHLLQMRPPQLLLLHLLETDVVQHRSGPRSPTAYSALARADARVGDVLQGLKATGLLNNSILFVVSDHGFATPSKLISPNVVLRKAGLLRPGPRRRAQIISEGGTAFVYLTNPETAGEDQEKVSALLRGVEGIESIITPAEYAPLHLPSPARNSQAGNLFLVAKAGYAFSDEFFEDEIITPIPIPLGSHGYLSTDPQMNGVFVAWGRGIKPGTKLGLVDNRDVAPTIAALFGKALPDAEGGLLRQLVSTNSLKPTAE